MNTIHCPNCDAPHGHHTPLCALGMFAAVVSDRGEKDAEQIAALVAACNADSLWESLGPVIDRFEAGDFSARTLPATE